MKIYSCTVKHGLEKPYRCWIESTDEPTHQEVMRKYREERGVEIEGGESVTVRIVCIGDRESQTTWV
jgi:hypothetical protein